MDSIDYLVQHLEQQKREQPAQQRQQDYTNAFLRKKNDESWTKECIVNERDGENVRNKDRFRKDGKPPIIRAMEDFLRW